MPTVKPIELRNVSAVLSEDGSISIAGVKLHLVPAEPKDKPYIISTWVRSYQRIQSKLVTAREGTMKKVGAEAYLSSYPQLVEDMWERTWVLRAEDSDACHGYICGFAGTLHYVYLPPELRELGLSRAMTNYVCGTDIVHVTNFWPKSWPKNWTYNPYRMFQ